MPGQALHSPKPLTFPRSVRPVRKAPEFWYKPDPLGVLLAPLGWLVALFAMLRLGTYRAGLRRTWRVGCPVIVIGNLSVGGTGKTPLVIGIAKFLAARGLRVGVVCRGYRGVSSRWPRKVRPDSDPARVGDEAGGACTPYRCTRRGRPEPHRRRTNPVSTLQVRRDRDRRWTPAPAPRPRRGDCRG